MNVSPPTIVPVHRHVSIPLDPIYVSATADTLELATIVQV
jgi:hypothetical protein